MNTDYTKSFDFNAIADDYDRHRRAGGVFFDTLAALAHSCSARGVLEIGSGTGNSATAFLQTYPCRLTCLEQSSGMLAQARGKTLPVNWLQGDGCALPFASNSFQFVFAVLVIHHVDDLAGLIRECHRVLDRGVVAFVSASHHFIEHHPMNRYFPSFAEIDKRRFPPISEVAMLMRDTGFKSVGAEYRTRPPEPVDAAFVEKVRNKYISTYALVPPEEFDRGIAQLERDVAINGKLETPLAWESVIIWAKK